MAKPEIEWTWNPDNKRFVNEQVDPSNGVRTTWENIPLQTVLIRTDRLSNLGLSRRIWDSGPDSGIWHDSTRYEVRDKTGRLHKSLDLHLRKPTGEMSVNLFLSHLKGGFDLFDAHYRHQGGLLQVSFDGNLLPGTRPQQAESMTARPYNESLDDLLQISKAKGLTSFFGPTGKFNWKHKDPNIDEIGFALSLGLLTYVDKIPKEQVPEILERAVDYADEELERRYGEDGFVKENGDVISLGLGIETVNQFAKHPNLSVPFSEVVADNFHAAVKYLLEDHYRTIQAAGEFNVKYYVDEMRFRIASGGQTNFESSFALRESIPFEEYTYTLSPTDQPNQLQIVVGNILRPDDHTRFIFPETVDFATIHSVISTPENTGWEDALELTPLDYHRGL